MAVGERRRRKVMGRERERSRYLFTADQVLRMVEAGILPEDEKIELLDGVLYKMTKGELHDAIVGNLAHTLRGAVPKGYHVREEKSNHADERSIPEPDIAVCLGGIFDYTPNHPPLEKLALVVEVTHTTRKADYILKLAKYAVAGIPFYWIIDVDRRRVLVHRDPETAGGIGRYGSLATFKPGDSLAVEIGGEVRGRIAVSDLFPPEPQNRP